MLEALIGLFVFYQANKIFPQNVFNASIWRNGPLKGKVHPKNVNPVLTSSSCWCKVKYDISVLELHNKTELQHWSRRWFVLNINKQTNKNKVSCVSTSDGVCANAFSLAAAVKISVNKGCTWSFIKLNRHLRVSRDLNHADELFGAISCFFM